MPIATIDAEGTQYAFIDSGPIHGHAYKTLLVFHGTVFNGESFEPLVPLFNRRGVRLLNISRRSYGATSEHSATDIANLAAGNNAFLKVLARDVANLLVWVLDNLGPFEEHSLYMIGWSMGTSTTLSLFGQKNNVAPETYDRIGRYLQKLIIYDSPLQAYGFDKPAHLDNQPPGVPSQSEVMAAFTMLSMYFDHPDLPSRQASGVNFTVNGVRPTLERMPAEELARCMDFKATITGAEAGTVPYAPIKQMLREQMETALFDSGMMLPLVTMTVIGCTSTAWAIIWAFIELERRYKQVVADGGHARAVTFVELAKANHFTHIDAPEEFVAFVVGIMGEQFWTQ